MNKRTKAIVSMLMEKDHLEQKELAVSFQVSERTIRNDLRDLNDYLLQNSLNPLVIERGKIQKEDDFSHIIQILETEELYNIKLTLSERSAIAATMLVSAKGYVTLAQIADHLYLSRQTIIKDLPMIKKLIRSFDLEVISQANKGLRIEGKESDRRRLLYRLYSQASESARKFMQVKAGDPTILSKIIREVEHSTSNFLSDASFDDLMLSLQIEILRLQQGNTLETMPDHSSSSFYPMAQVIQRYLQQYLGVEVSLDEINALCHELELLSYFKKTIHDSNNLKAQVLTRSFISAVSDELGVNLNQDYVFFENLSAHILSVLSGEAPKYPDQSLLKDVMEENPEVLEAAAHARHIFAPFARREITQEDLMFISIHILAALEKRRNLSSDLRIIVACHGGVGTSQYLAERLRRHFDFHIVNVISAHHVSSLRKEDADLIITTVPIKQAPIESVQISPFFNDDDYVRIVGKTEQIRNSRFLWDRVSEPGRNAADLIRQIEPVVENLAPEQAEILNHSLRRIIRDYFKEPALQESEIFSPYLHHMLLPDSIQLDIEAADWKEAVRKSAEPMLEKMSIEPRYIDNMIASIEENGPYIVLVPHFAVPHDATDAGSLKTDMNLIRLKNPVNFDHEDHDPVRYVCCLSAADQKTHLRAFFNLVNILQNPAFLPALDQAATPLEAAGIIEKFEYELS